MVVEQLIRPTGLLDPEVVVRPSENQIDDLMEEITVRVERGARSCYYAHEADGGGVDGLSRGA